MDGASKFRFHDDLYNNTISMLTRSTILLKRFVFLTFPVRKAHAFQKVWLQGHCHRIFEFAVKKTEQNQSYQQNKKKIANNLTEANFSRKKLLKPKDLRSNKVYFNKITVTDRSLK